jgi:uncharacterized lipoprotein YajG
MVKSIFVWLATAVALAACATPATPTAAPTPVPAASSAVSSVASSTPARAASCTTTDAAPPDKFRSDDPAKLDANNTKPKLVEFFAYW